MVSHAATPARRLAGLRLMRRARPVDATDVTSAASERETLRRHHEAERQREAREREFERRWRLHL